jgi:hypothetical protein
VKLRIANDWVALTELGRVTVTVRYTVSAVPFAIG